MEFWVEGRVLGSWASGAGGKISSLLLLRKDQAEVSSDNFTSSQLLIFASFLYDGRTFLDFMSS